jgi:hypothetical protein
MGVGTARVFWLPLHPITRAFPIWRISGYFAGVVSGHSCGAATASNRLPRGISVSSMVFINLNYSSKMVSLVSTFFASHQRRRMKRKAWVMHWSGFFRQLKEIFDW